jgi:uncharacterized membrane protein YozB (DUF420 family)
VTYDDLPALNASLNAAVTVVILIGRRKAKARDVRAHRALMLTAVALSAIFLASYLTYHFGKAGLMTTFKGEGAARVVYYSILFTHLPLAAILLPLLGIALTHALRGNIEKHRRIVRVAWPVWLYVSVTGVLIYLMLYQVYA